jgi:NDP-sugar pyrophosphorylase family protein
MIHVVIPAAGSGQRFADAGYRQPKALIDVAGVPMLQRVIDNIRPSRAHRVTVISQVPLPGIGVEVVLTGPTGGAVESILKADIGDGPLLVANCDQLVGLDLDDMLQGDGCVATFRSAKPHHSYVRLDEAGYVVEVAEKRVISHHAVAGLYYFADGARFVAAARSVVDNDRRVLGEFYVSSVLAELVEAGKKLATVGTDVAVLGTPEELELFLMASRVAGRL